MLTAVYHLSGSRSIDLPTYLSVCPSMSVLIGLDICSAKEYLHESGMPFDSGEEADIDM